MLAHLMVHVMPMRLHALALTLYMHIKRLYLQMTPKRQEETPRTPLQLLGDKVGSEALLVNRGRKAKLKPKHVGKRRIYRQKPNGFEALEAGFF